MNTLNHLKGNFILSAVGVGMGIASKKLLKKEFLAVSSTGQIIKSYFFLLSVTIAGKLVMDKVFEMYWIPEGKNKVENEGFIGPLPGDLLYLMEPNRWTPRPNSNRSGGIK